MRIRLAIFDLEGTLHNSERLINNYHNAFVQFISTELKVGLPMAEARLGQARIEIESLTGKQPGEFVLLKALGLDVRDWLLYSVRNISAASYLIQNTGLRRTLLSISPRVILDVCTNTELRLANETLHAIGIDDLISRLWAPDASKEDLGGFPISGKPNADLYRKILSIRRVKIDEVLIFGDRIHVDLQPAHELHIRAVRTNGPADIVSYVESHINDFSK